MANAGFERKRKAFKPTEKNRSAEGYNVRRRAGKCAIMHIDFTDNNKSILMYSKSSYGQLMAISLTSTSWSFHGKK